MKFCDVCGGSHHDIRMDKRIKEVTGLEVHICLDCYAWLGDYHRYQMLLENEVIDDDMFYELLAREEK